jgi:isoaspartyl peptidase/L-asparaginase-like protein (Ntn-hydrolase superfamily)
MATARAGNCSTRIECRAISRCCKPLADMASASADAACEASLARIAALGGTVGIIALDGAGGAGFAHNSPSFAVAWQAEGAEAQAFQTRAEARERGWEAT